MKYDDYEKVECNNYPNENITVELGRRPKKLKGLKGFDGKIGRASCRERV